MRLAILFRRIGPYHRARIRAASSIGEVASIETEPEDKTYDWDAVLDMGDVRRLQVRKVSARVCSSGSECVADVEGALEVTHPTSVAIAGWSDGSSMRALRWCLKRKVPAIVMSPSNECDAPRRGWKEKIKRALVSGFSTGFVGGAKSKMYLCKLGMRSDNIFEGYDVVDNSHFANGAESARLRDKALRVALGVPRQYFLACTRFVEKKNLAFLVRAYSQYHSRAGLGGWSLVLVGDGPQRQELESLVRKEGLLNEVYFAGFRQYDELPAYYGLAGAFVHASTVEQWGLVVNEAMAAGLPVVVSNRCGCTNELVKDGVNGYSFDPTDFNQLVGLLHHIASKSVDRESMARKSQDIVDQWSPERWGQSVWDAVHRAGEVQRPGPDVVRSIVLSLAKFR